MLVQHIYDTLVDEIVTGVLPPGSSVMEAELRERFQVSRTPVREVLLRLSEVGLVEIYPQVGSYVAPIRLQEVYDAQFVREHLECALVREAVAKLTQDDAAELQANLKMQEDALRSGDHRRFMAADEAMHALIARIAGRPDVWQVVLQSKIHLDRVRMQALQQLTRGSYAFEGHQKVCQAIIAHDADAAVLAMKQHLNLSLESIGLLHLSEPDAEK